MQFEQSKDTVKNTLSTSHPSEIHDRLLQFYDVLPNSLSLQFRDDFT